jgi:hypothetical protein
MKLSKNQDRSSTERSATPAGSRSCWGRILACLAVLAALSGAAQPGQQQVQRDPAWSAASPSANRMPDPNDMRQMRDQQTVQQSYEAANAERKKLIADDSAKMLKLAADLKAEVDKTNADMLSVNVIRKAAEIEKLAHSIKQKMKSTVGAS